MLCTVACRTPQPSDGRCFFIRGASAFLLLATMQIFTKLGLVGHSGRGSDRRREGEGEGDAKAFGEAGVRCEPRRNTMCPPNPVELDRPCSIYLILLTILQYPHVYLAKQPPRVSRVHTPHRIRWCWWFRCSPVSPRWWPGVPSAGCAGWCGWCGFSEDRA